MAGSPFERLREHAREPHHYGPLEDADVVLEGGNPECGDVVTIYLKLHPDGRTISDAHFAGEGCGVSQAAASLLLEHLHQHGWTLDDVIQADFRLVQELVGPEAARARPQCASLALSVLKAAVQKVERSRRHAEVERARDETNES